MKAQLPTLLGVDPWSCYWSWTWQHMGATKYLHYPEMWGQLEFVSHGEHPAHPLELNSSTLSAADRTSRRRGRRSHQSPPARCLNIEFPGRCAKQAPPAHHLFTCSPLALSYLRSPSCQACGNATLLGGNRLLVAAPLLHSLNQHADAARVLLLLSASECVQLLPAR